MPIDSMLFKKMHQKEVGKAEPTPVEPVKKEEGYLVGEPMTVKEFGEAVIQATQDRKTFTVPDGHVAIRDSEGRATGETRPIDDSDSLMADISPAHEPSTTGTEVAIYDSGASAEEAEKAGPQSFKHRLDELDKLVSSQLGINAFTIDAVRGHVKQIMMDLTTQPELEAILIDRDVHNVLRFIRHVKDDASATRVVVKEKKAVAAKKAKKIKGGLSGFTFEGLTLPGMKEAQPGMPATLGDLGRMKT